MKPTRRRPRRTVKYDGPDPIDVFVAARMKLRRLERGVSQSALGKHLGVSFQAVQKYEGGEIRLAASKLYRLAHALEVPLTYFFDGYEASQTVQKVPRKAKR
jgi:transcriptional regulator with XRE-family HTH domain